MQAQGEKTLRYAPPLMYSAPRAGRRCRGAGLVLGPAFIATLAPNDPLFAAEFVPALRENFENPRLMREFGLILENLDGFDDLPNKFVRRGVPHTLALRAPVASPQGPRTGWSGDGAPGDRCHANAGANASFGNLGNANFDTGVENLPDQPARLSGEQVPRDDGLGTPGDGTVNTPPLVETADSGPFVHNNAIETIEGAVAFYDGAAFNGSPSGRAVGGIELDGAQIVAIAAFLRVLNALQNIRSGRGNLESARRLGLFERQRSGTLLRRALIDTGNAVKVLAGGGLHPQAVRQLESAVAALDAARATMIETAR